MDLERTNGIIKRRKLTSTSDQICINCISKLLCRCFSSFISMFQNSCHGHRVRPLERAREEVVWLRHFEQEAEGSFLPLQLVPPLGRMLWRHEKRGGKAVLWNELPQCKYKWFISNKGIFFLNSLLIRMIWNVFCPCLLCSKKINDIQIGTGNNRYSAWKDDKKIISSAW